MTDSHASWGFINERYAAAARTGRLNVTFGTRSVFGRPVRLVTRGLGATFMRTVDAGADAQRCSNNDHRRARRQLGSAAQSCDQCVGPRGQAVMITSGVVYLRCEGYGNVWSIPQRRRNPRADDPRRF